MGRQAETFNLEVHPSDKPERRNSVLRKTVIAAPRQTKEVKDELEANHQPLAEVEKWLRNVSDALNYHAVPGNIVSLRAGLR